MGVGAVSRRGKVARFQLKSTPTPKSTLLTMGDDAKLEEIQKLGGTAIKPVGWDRTGWEAFQYMLYNPDTGEVLTRTPLSWLKITVFYCIYYCFLAGFWIACLNVFFATLPDAHDGPRWLQEDSIIGVNPGVGLRPRNTDARIDSQMFVLRQSDTNTHQSENGGEGDLNADYNYGYVVPNKMSKSNTTTPCIFIKLNTIWGWVPKPYDCDKEKGEDSEGRCLPDIEKHLAKQGADKNNFVYINCRGRYAADQEALAGGLKYFPENQGLPISYFPYVGKGVGAGGNYHAPLVAVKITPKKGSEGQLIHIECRAYYDGVKHITKTKEGMVMFELQIKDE